MVIKQKKIYFYFALLLLVLIIILLLKNFLTIIISSIVITYLLHPLHEKLSRKIGKNISAFFIVAITFSVALLVLIIVINSIFHQSMKFFTPERINLFVNQSFSIFKKLGISETIVERILSYKETAISSIFSFIINTSKNIPKIFFGILMMTFMVYYFLIGWKDLTKRVFDILPFKEKNIIKQRIHGITKNIALGFGLISIMETLVSGIGFYIAGVPIYLLLSVIIGIIAFIPFIGPVAIWLPLSIYYFFTGNIYAFIIVLITGIIISVFIENFFMHIFIGKKANIHPIIMLLGVLGGVPIFGILGIIIGPLLLAISIEIIEKEML